jgi:hypothetical protein
MSDIAVLCRPGAVEPVITPRDRWQQAVAKLREEEARLTALNEGQDRARRSLWDARDQLVTAKAELQRARTANKQELAYAFVIEGVALDRTDVSTAEAQVEAIEREIEHWERIEEAITGEIAQCERRLRLRRLDANSCRRNSSARAKRSVHI